LEKDENCGRFSQHPKKWFVKGCVALLAKQYQMREPMGKEQALEKIRKLLAMAEKNSGATENEMRTAMTIAHALMVRHQLSKNLVQGFRRTRRHWDLSHTSSTRG
jgi:hypothetical protein